MLAVRGQGFAPLGRYAIFPQVPWDAIALNYAAFLPGIVYSIEECAGFDSARAIQLSQLSETYES